MSKLQGNLKRYGTALLAVLIASAITAAAEPLFGGKAPLFFFTIAVIVAAGQGFGPGVVATVLSVASVLLLFREIYTMIMANASLTLFALLGLGISAVMGRLHRINAALVETKEALQLANERLSERGRALSLANEELQRFAYVLAHDLNGSVRVICNLTELLVQQNTSKLDDNSKECAGLIVSKGLRMQAMIQGLLDYAAAVERPAEKTHTDAGTVVHRAIKDLDAMIHARGAVVTADEPLPHVDAVESRLVQVFSNLISNGIKYCPVDRSPRIQISATERSVDIVFCVADNGIGMDMKYAGSIFGMFNRLHGDEYEGTGIGLALCKAVIERHGGCIWVESQVGQGSQFYFTLPRPDITGQAKGAGQSQRRPTDVVSSGALGFSQ